MEQLLQRQCRQPDRKLTGSRPPSAPPWASRAKIGTSRTRALRRPRRRPSPTRATAKGIYVILDWHDHNAHQHLDPAKSYFREVAQAYKNTPNVIFEIFNEPSEHEHLARGETHAEAGSPRSAARARTTWSAPARRTGRRTSTSPRTVPQRSERGVHLHLYANTHKGRCATRPRKAINKKLALFVDRAGDLLRRRQRPAQPGRVADLAQLPGCAQHQLGQLVAGRQGRGELRAQAQRKPDGQLDRQRPHRVGQR